MKSLIQITVVCLFVLALPALSYGHLSVESYCQVAIGIAQQQTDYLTGLVPLIDKYCDDPNLWGVYVAEPNTFLAETAVLKKARDEQRAPLLSSYDTTAGELYAFEDWSQEAIAQYLTDNPDTAQAISDLSAGIDAIMSKLKVPYYCLAVVANAEQEILHVSELINQGQQNANDADIFLAQEQDKRKEHSVAKDALFAAFDTTANGYLTFMSKNAKVVEQYLADHPAIKATIDDLPNQVAPLLDQYETLREGIVGEPGEPSPPTLEL